MTFTKADAARVHAAAASALEDLAPAGFGLGVVEGRDMVFAQGFGFADIETGRRQAPELRQRIGSITKTMVGLCVMALADEGRIGLDDRLIDLLPELVVDGAADAATIRTLLTHTAGIGEVPTAKDVKASQATLWADAHDADVMAMFPDGLTLDVAPGTKWAYANLGFALLGEIVARKEGAPIAEVVRRRIFAPLRMANTDLLDQPHADLTTPYHHAPNEEAREFAAKSGTPLPDETPVDGRNFRGRYQYIRGVAAGAVQSTVPDMARYAAALLADGGGIVRPETFRAMIAPHWRPDPRLDGWGLSFSLDRQFGLDTFGHGGGVLGGWQSMLTIIPARAQALILHCNTSFDAFGKLVDRIAAALLDAAPQQARGKKDDAVLAAAPGVFEAEGGVLTNFRVMAGTGRLQIKKTDNGLALYARRGPWKSGVAMRPADPADGGFFALDDNPLNPTRVALLRDGAGGVSGLRLDGLIEMKRTEAVEPWA